MENITLELTGYDAVTVLDALAKAQAVSQKALNKALDRNPNHANVEILKKRNNTLLALYWELHGKYTKSIVV